MVFVSVRRDFQQRSNSNNKKKVNRQSIVSLLYLNVGFYFSKFSDYVYPGNRLDFEINLFFVTMQSKMLIGFLNKYYEIASHMKQKGRMKDNRKNRRTEIETQIRSWAKISIAQNMKTIHLELSNVNRKKCLRFQ